jgi:hypothetical protein
MPFAPNFGAKISHAIPIMVEAELASRKLPRKWRKIPKHILKEYSIRSPLSQGTYPPIKEGLHPL